MDYQKIKLLGGAEITIDLDSKNTKCKKCGKMIKFGITKNGKSMPIIKNGDSWQSHFTDCEYASDFRRNPSEQRIADEERNQEYLNNL